MSQFFNIQWTIGAALDSRGPGFEPQMGYPLDIHFYAISPGSIEGSCQEKSAHPTVYLVGRVVANY